MVPLMMLEMKGFIGIGCRSYSGLRGRLQEYAVLNAAGLNDDLAG